MHKRYPKSWWAGLDESLYLTRSWDAYDKSINTYNVKVGTTLEFLGRKRMDNENEPLWMGSMVL